MRYQIADGIIDYMHLCWLAFLLAPLDTFTMGGAAVFSPLRERFPNVLTGTAMLALIVIPALSVRLNLASTYVIARCLSAGFFAYLSWLCLIARPISTGIVYAGVSLGCTLLALRATRYTHEEA